MRSDLMKKGIEKSPHRALFKAMGYSDEELVRPMVGVANSANQIIPGHIHLNNISDAVKAGIRMAGGTPIEFSTIGVCDGIAMNHEGMKYSLGSRELIADSIEVMAMAHPFDGLVMVTNCDKIVPGMLMAALRLNVPSVIISGGPMLAGRYRGKDIDLIKVFEGMGAVEAGKMSEEELREIEETACPGCGSCSGMYTANTMNCLTEALGLGLPGNGTVPAVDSGRIRLAKQAGSQVMELIKLNIRPRDIATLSAFKNAIVIDMALGGSTNTVLHLPAIAREAELEFELKLFDALSKKTPHLCNLNPVGPHHIQDLHEAGGVQAVIKEIDRRGLVEKDALTVTGATVGENIARAEVRNRDVIRPVDDPYHEEGGIAILYGNLAPEGAVVKQSGVAPEMLHKTGTARTFDSEEESLKAIRGGKIGAGDIVIIRHEGPKGGPGMREMLTPTSAIVGMGLDKEVVLLTDGRFSGGTWGAAIGHISPEAAEGGPIALIKDGDVIEVDIPNKRLTLKVEEAELKKRKEAWNPPEPKLKKGYLLRYSQLVTSASTGAVLKDKLS